MNLLRPRRSTRDLWTAFLAAGLAACSTLVTPVPLSEQLGPLDLAMSEAPQIIGQRAEAGEAEAQLAFAILARHGLHGVAVEPQTAQYWEERALASRRSMPITQYTAAFNGQPSRVNIINVPVAEVSQAQLSALRACIRFLTVGDIGPGVCGDAQETARRQALWRVAASRRH